MSVTRTARDPFVYMLAAILCINYIDRGLLPVAGALVQSDLGLEPRQLGLLFSAFWWTYAVVQIPVGWAAERFGAHRVLAAGLVLWAASTALFGIASGFAALFALRLLLGLGESVGFPSVSKLVAQAVPMEGLGTANGIIAFGFLFGPAIGTFLGVTRWRSSGGARRSWALDFYRCCGSGHGRARPSPIRSDGRLRARGRRTRKSCVSVRCGEPVSASFR